jgi:hypothetical protein
MNERTCIACRHFRNGGRELEAYLPGLSALSSVDGSTRGDDGLCLHHDRFTRPAATCADFAVGAKG